MVTRALIYNRVSEDRAAGRSVAEQETEARAVCDREGWDIVEVVTDNSVGASRYSKGKRAGWEKAKKIIGSGDVDVLVTWASSRAQRDLEAYTELRRLCADAGVRWSYSGRTYDLTDHDDRFRTGLDALMSEREAGEMAYNIRRSVRANAFAGRPHGRRLFGYQRIYDPTSGALVGQEPLPEQAAVVRRIFDEYLAGKGVRTIARDLNSDGVATSTGKGAWSDAQIRDVLVKPAYTALRVHQGVVIGEANWEPLIDRDRYDKVQERLAAKRSSNTRQTRNANLLSGVSRCGVCGGKVGRGHDRNHRKTYLCRGKFCVGRDLAALDAYVTTIVLERLAQPDAVITPAESPHLVAAREEIAALTAQIDDAFGEFRAGRLTAAMLARVEADIAPRVDAARKLLRRGAIPIEIDIPDDNLDGWWDDLGQQQDGRERQREIIGALVEVVWIHPTKRGGKTFDPNAIQVELRG